MNATTCIILQWVLSVECQECKQTLSFGNTILHTPNEDKDDPTNMRLFTLIRIAPDRALEPLIKKAQVDAEQELWSKATKLGWMQYDYDHDYDTSVICPKCRAKGVT